MIILKRDGENETKSKTGKKKSMALAGKVKHVEIEMIKVKPVITAVTRVLSHMLAVCLTALGSP